MRTRGSAHAAGVGVAAASGEIEWSSAGTAESARAIASSSADAMSRVAPARSRATIRTLCTCKSVRQSGCIRTVLPSIGSQRSGVIPSGSSDPSVAMPAMMNVALPTSIGEPTALGAERRAVRQKLSLTTMRSRSLPAFCQLGHLPGRAVAPTVCSYDCDTYAAVAARTSPAIRTPTVWVRTAATSSNVRMLARSLSTSAYGSISCGAE